jgi:hypothetical protein
VSIAADTTDKAPRAMTATEAAAAGYRALDMDESRDLIALEKIVAKGLQTFAEVGDALAEIRDRKLYKIEHATFADYCKQKWKMSDRRARQLMDAAAVVFDIRKSGTTVPVLERQVRPLTSIPKEQHAEAWQAAVATSATGIPTAKEVEHAVLSRCVLAPRREKNAPLPNRLGGNELVEFLNMKDKVAGRLQTLLDAFPSDYHRAVLALISEWVHEEIAVTDNIRSRKEAV